MKKLILLVLIASSGFFNSQTTQDISDFEFYYGYKDYLNDAPVKSNVNGEVKVATDKYFKVGKFRYKDSDKKAKPENFAWAIKYNGNLYFNMWSAAYIFSDFYVKVDIVSKRYWVIFIDEKKDRKIIGSNNPYGGGLVGVMLNVKPKSSWKSKDGNTYKILMVDFENPHIEKTRPKDNNAFLVDTKKILELTNNDPEVLEKLKNNTYTSEDFAEFVKSKI